MPVDTHIRRGHPIVFGLMILFAIVELAISAWLTARYANHHAGSNAQVRARSRFLVFASCWTILFSLVYALGFWFYTTGSILTSVASHGIFLFLTWVWWTAGAAAITAALGGGQNCSHSQFAYCGQLNAAEAFAWIEWILVTVAVFVVLLRGLVAVRRGDGFKGQLVDTA